MIRGEKLWIVNIQAMRPFKIEKTKEHRFILIILSPMKKMMQTKLFSTMAKNGRF